MVPESVLQEFLKQGRREGTLAEAKLLEARPPRYGSWPRALDPRLRSAFELRGLERLYCHQSAAVQAVLEGQSVVVVTPTASGKTLCYNLPVLDAILKQPGTRALYVFPTKALSQDQRAELQDTIESLEEPIAAYTYDGDTPDDARRAIRERGHIIVTNPDMLHQGILPHHTRWAKCFQNLRYVVLDELHTYRGVFGSHVCNVLRRLQRVCRFHGSKPVFICCSATIANPRQLAERLLERPVKLVDDNGAPQGEKYFCLHNPPVVNAELGLRRSYLNETRRVALRFLQENLQTIVFATSRLKVEVLSRYLREACEKLPEQKGRIRGYRGGYLPKERRQIERGLREGRILGAVTTNALELGIDLGGLDVSVIAGYPGTIASTWQQAGRAGRRSGRSLAILVARSDPMDQFLVTHPEYFFGRSPEHALIDPDNLLILASHLKCAVFELPFRDDEAFGSKDVRELLEYLAEQKVFRHVRDKWHWNQEVYPADLISLRRVSNENFVIMDEGPPNRVIAEVDYASAPSTVYPDAIYMCQDRLYNVSRLQYDQNRAYVRKVEADYYTEAITNTAVKVLEVFQAEQREASGRGHGDVHVAWRVSGFKKIKFYTRENVGYGDVQLPDQEMHTTSYWLTLRTQALDEFPFSRAELLDGVLGLGYLMHQVAPFLLMCDVRDLNRSIGDRSGEWHVRSEWDRPAGSLRTQLADSSNDPLGLEQLDSFAPTIFLYDNYPGGIGLSAKLYELEETLLSRVKEILETCPCEEGCPSCVGPRNEVGARSKVVARDLAAIVRGA